VSADSKHTQPLHVPVSWLDPEAQDDIGAQFVALAMDVCNGVNTCLELIHATDIAVMAQDPENDPPILGINDREHLLLLARASTRMLGDRAWNCASQLNDRARKDSATLKEAK
jgi:hypothetical protein